MRTRKPTTKNIHTFAHSTTATTERWAETNTVITKGVQTTVCIYSVLLDIETGVYTYCFEASYANGTGTNSTRELEATTAQKMIGVWTNQFGN